MEYRERQVKKLIAYSIYLAVILAVAAVVYIVGDESMREFVVPFATAFAAVGIVRIILGVRLLRDEERLRDREIAEKDERNLSISQRAKGIAFFASAFAGCIAIITLSLLDMRTEAKTVALCVSFMVVVYYFGYLFLQKKY